MIARFVLGSLLSVALAALAACSSGSSPSSHSANPVAPTKAPVTGVIGRDPASAPVPAAAPAVIDPAVIDPADSSTAALSTGDVSSLPLVAPPVLAQALDYSGANAAPANPASANPVQPDGVPAPATSSLTAARALTDIAARAAAHPSAVGVAAEVAEVTKKLAAAHPDVAGNVLMVSRISLPNSTLFEVVTPQAILYTDKDVNYLMVGQLLVGEGSTVQDITHRPALEAFLSAKAQEKSAGAPTQPSAAADKGGDAKAVFDALPFASGWTTTYAAKGQAIPASHHVVVFEDPDCEYCQKLVHDLPAIGAQVGGLTVTVFPFVLESKHPNGLAHARALVCTADPGKAWASWMKFAYGKDTAKAWAQWSPKNAPVAACPRTKLIDAWQTAGHALGFESTPMLMFPSGASTSGVLTADQFSQVFALLDAHPETWTNPSPAAAVKSIPDLEILGSGAPAPTLIPPGPSATTVPVPMTRPSAPSVAKNPKAFPPGVKMNQLLGGPTAAASTSHSGK